MGLQIGNLLLESYHNETRMQKLLMECNNSLAGIKVEEQIPKSCFYRMKWRRLVTDEAMQKNKKQINVLGEFENTK